MIYMLDTDTCSYIMRQYSRNVLKSLEDRACQGHILCMSVITYQELRFGAERAGAESYHHRIDKVCERMDYVAEWTVECADKFAITQSLLFEKGVPIGFTDAMIASHALIIDATLVTNNEKHFSRVEGVRLENWLKAPASPSFRCFPP